MRSSVSSIVLALVAATSLASTVRAQGATSAARPLPAADSLFKRARRLVSEGDGAAGRAIVDSLLRAAPEGTPAFGDALYWRGALSETAADAERDYRRVIVEYPLSVYADDALLSLAELEQARGDRSAAYQHLQRFVREHPMGPARARAGLAAARLAFEQRDVGRGCAMIADARQSIGTEDVELRNQIEYQGARCPATSTTTRTPTAAPSVQSAGATTSASAPPSTTNATRHTATGAVATPTKSSPTPPSNAPPMRDDDGESRPALSAVATKPDVAKPAAVKPAAVKPEPTKGSAAKDGAAPRGVWTIQLAAYNTRADADALVRKLAARGVKARVSGETKPFRVRLDYYQTRQEAATRVAELRQRGIIGFVTDEPRATGAARP